MVASSFRFEFSADIFERCFSVWQKFVSLNIFINVTEVTLKIKYFLKVITSFQLTYSADSVCLEVDDKDEKEEEKEGDSVGYR